MTSNSPSKGHQLSTLLSWKLGFQQVNFGSNTNIHKSSHGIIVKWHPCLAQLRIPVSVDSDHEVAFPSKGSKRSKYTTFPVAI